MRYSIANQMIQSLKKWIYFLGSIHISPLIRWKKKKKKKPWPLNLMVTIGLIGNVVPGFEAEYAHTAHTVTPEMREAYVVD